MAISRQQLISVGAVLILGVACLSGCTSTPVAVDVEPTSTQVAPAPAETSPPTSSSLAPGQGCPANDLQVPGDAVVGQIGDVDGDGQPDEQFYVETGGFAYGIHTASGATIILPDDLAGPNTHSGWSVTTGQNVVATVLADGRSATLHGFVNCAFTIPVGIGGQPYTFSLAGFSDTGTGVACGPADASGYRKIFGVDARPQSDGRYTIKSTEVDLSADGRTATNGASMTDSNTYVSNDLAVTTSMTARCEGIEAVHTSGK